MRCARKAATVPNLRQEGHEELEETVYRSIEIKASIVEQDEREHGIRKILNLGHTYGHAIELYGGYNEFSHGEAVAIGEDLFLHHAVNRLSCRESINSVWRKYIVGYYRCKQFI